MLANLKFSALIAAVLAITTTNAVVVHMYSDQRCRDFIEERNVWDNTCAHTQGFSSYRLISAGGSGQMLRSYSPNACVVPITSCVTAYGNVLDGECFDVKTDAGASNAFSSYWGSC